MAVNCTLTFVTGWLIVFGCKEPKPIVNLPAGAKCRLRLRHDDRAKAYVRTAQGTACYGIEAKDGQWRIAFEYPLACNHNVS